MNGILRVAGSRCSVAILAMQLSASALQSQVVVIPNELPLRIRINNLAINGVLGSATGLVWAIIRHSPKWGSVGKGAVGGLLMSAGKQVAVARFDGAGFVGREVSAVGASLAVSSGKPHPPFTFPIGPMNLDLVEGNWDWRLNVTDLVAIASFALSSHTRFDLHKSLSSGTPVFRDDRDTFGTAGDYVLTASTQFGTVGLSRGAFDPFTGKANVLYHERVHILQDDFFEEAISLPAERAAVEHLPFGRRFLKHLDVGALGPILENQASRLIPYRSRPWEREAYALTAHLIY